MRIGVLTTSFPTHARDISGLFVLGFCRALAARGHTLEVLAPEPSERVATPVHPGIETHFVPYLRPRSLQRTFYGAGVPDNLRRDALAALGLLPFPIALTGACLKRAGHWDAVVSHWALPSALVAGVTRGRKPHLAVLHSADVHMLCNLPMRRPLAAHIATHADRLWFVASQHRDAFVDLLADAQRPSVLERCFVSPMGIDPPVAVDRQAARTALGLHGFTALVLGRLLPIKGVDVAIEAAADSGMTLMIAGDGPDRPALEAHARRLGADVRFLGTLTGRAKAEALAAADAFLNTSRVLPNGRGEGVPTALLEAMAHGLPVVATRTGGMPSVIDDRHTGLLVPPGDPQAVRDALTDLSTDAGLRTHLGSGAKARSEAFLWPELAGHAETLLQAPGRTGDRAPVSVA